MKQLKFLVIVCFISLLSACSLNVSPNATTTPQPIITITSSPSPTIAPTPTPETKITLIDFNDDELPNLKLLNGNPIKGLNATASSVQNVYNALGMNLVIKDCAEFKASNPNQKFITGNLGTLALKASVFYYEESKNTCFNVFMDRNNFETKNGKSGKYLLIIGVIYTDMDKNISSVNNFKYFGSWQPLLYEVLPKAVNPKYYGAFITEEAYNWFIYALNPYFDNTNKETYSTMVLDRFPLSMEQYEALLPLVNPNNDWIVMDY